MENHDLLLDDLAAAFAPFACHLLSSYDLLVDLSCKRVDAVDVFYMEPTTVPEFKAMLRPVIPYYANVAETHGVDLRRLLWFRITASVLWNIQENCTPHFPTLSDMVHTTPVEVFGRRVNLALHADVGLPMITPVHKMAHFFRVVKSGRDGRYYHAALDCWETDVDEFVARAKRFHDSST